MPRRGIGLELLVLPALFSRRVRSSWLNRRRSPSAKRWENAGGEPRPIAGATEERTLLDVGSSAWLDSGCKGVNLKLPTLWVTQNDTAIFFYTEILKPFCKLGELLTLAFVKGPNSLCVHDIHDRNQ